MNTKNLTLTLTALTCAAALLGSTSSASAYVEGMAWLGTEAYMEDVCTPAGTYLTGRVLTDGVSALIATKDSNSGPYFREVRVLCNNGMQYGRGTRVESSGPIPPAPLAVACQPGWGSVAYAVGSFDDL